MSQSMQHSNDISSPIGLVAGGGQFPLLIARSVKAKGRKVVAVAHKGETDQELAKEADALEWIHLGQLGRLIEILKAARVKEAVFAGTITKKRIFWDVRPDLRALSLWKTLKNRLDDGILRAVASELEKEGILLLPTTAFLSDNLMPEGILTATKPTHEQMEDITFGLGLAKEIGRLDIGQCIVVKDKAVLAVEAIEGTDETILRAGRLSGEGAVVIKICKPNQDMRFDLPTIGLKTIETMIEANAKVLAAEAGKSMFFDMAKAIDMADKAKIAIIGVK